MTPVSSVEATVRRIDWLKSMLVQIISIAARNTLRARLDTILPRTETKLATITATLLG